MFVPQLRQRTVFPRHVGGTISTFRHVRFGHMILRFGPASLATIAPKGKIRCCIGTTRAPLHSDRRVARFCDPWLDGPTVCFEGPASEKRLPLQLVVMARPEGQAVCSPNEFSWMKEAACPRQVLEV